MEQVLFRLHIRFITAFCESISSSGRSLIARLSLLNALVALLVLLHLHAVYVSPVYSSLSDPSTRYSNCLLEQIRVSEMGGLSLLRIVISDPPYEFSNSLWWSPPDQTCPQTQTQRLYLFSVLEKGYVALSSKAYTALNMTSREVLISTDASCLGNSLQRWLVRNFVGYDTVVINWSMHLGLNFHQLSSSYEPGQPVGYLRNTRSNFIYELKLGNSFNASDLRSQWGVVAHIGHRVGLLATTLLLFFLSTTMVSFILRETQARMLKFTFILHYRVRNTVPYWDLVTSHVIEIFIFIPIIVGIMFFLNEFYAGDRLIGFLTLTVVWMAEVYSVIW